MKNAVIKIISENFSGAFYENFHRNTLNQMKNKDFKAILKIVQKPNTFNIIKYLSKFNTPKVISKLNYIYNSCSWYGDDDRIYYLVDDKTLEIKYKFAHYENVSVEFSEMHKKDIPTTNVTYTNGCFEYVYIDGNILTKPLIPYSQKINTSWENGKNEIKSWYFKPEFGILYHIKLKIDDIVTNKIGITSKDLHQRFGNTQILESHTTKMLMLEAATIEKALHKTLQPLRHYFDNEFAGKHECYRGSVMSYDIDILEAIEILDIDNYLNIPKGQFLETLNYQRSLHNLDLISLILD